MKLLKRDSTPKSPNDKLIVDLFLFRLKMYRDERTLFFIFPVCTYFYYLIGFFKFPSQGERYYEIHMAACVVNMLVIIILFVVPIITIFKRNLYKQKRLK